MGMYDYELMFSVAQACAVASTPVYSDKQVNLGAALRHIDSGYPLRIDMVCACTATTSPTVQFNLWAGTATPNPTVIMTGSVLIFASPVYALNATTGAHATHLSFLIPTQAIAAYPNTDTLQYLGTSYAITGTSAALTITCGIVLDSPNFPSGWGGGIAVAAS